MKTISMICIFCVTTYCVFTSEEYQEKYSSRMELSSLPISLEVPAAVDSSLAVFLSFSDPNEGLDVKTAYLRDHAELAIEEMKNSGIPASIKLAQGLLESNAGRSILAKKTNNHFGMKCFKKSCAKGHCYNFKDDSHKDFFRAYEDPAESYKAHSQFLKGGTRYSKLFELDKNDYKGWARGLKKCGYATDPKYADKLISVIERYRLNELDG